LAKPCASLGITVVPVYVIVFRLDIVAVKPKVLTGRSVLLLDLGLFFDVVEIGQRGGLRFLLQEIPCRGMAVPLPIRREL